MITTSTTDLIIGGMTCASCAARVERKLNRLDGVTGVTVELVPGGPSAVTVTSDRALPAGVVAAALDEAGDYQLAGN